MLVRPRARCRPAGPGHKTARSTCHPRLSGLCWNFCCWHPQCRERRAWEERAASARPVSRLQTPNLLRASLDFLPGLWFVSPGGRESRSEGAAWGAERGGPGSPGPAVGAAGLQDRHSPPLKPPSPHLGHKPLPFPTPHPGPWSPPFKRFARAEVQRGLGVQRGG